MALAIGLENLKLSLSLAVLAVTELLNPLWPDVTGMALLLVLDAPAKLNIGRLPDSGRVKLVGKSGGSTC